MPNYLKPLCLVLLAAASPSVGHAKRAPQAPPSMVPVVTAIEPAKGGFAIVTKPQAEERPATPLALPIGGSVRIDPAIFTRPTRPFRSSQP